ncbi:MAG: NAD(P)/FAD-dependent oxidoreductase [Candidatus Odinarchaeota archaeon]|nr:NAD(P)/FAD-dependent oxidoreductase [Candidatus Odinarchaeota archaeon]
MFHLLWRFVSLRADVAIIGAGPAGMFAAYELSNNTNLSIVIIEKGSDVDKRKCPEARLSYCAKCNPCNIISGVGGAGTLSSGLLNLNPEIGGDLIKLTGSEEKAWELVNYVDKIFLKFGAPKEAYEGSEEDIIELKRRAAASGIKFIPIKQRHLGTDRSPMVIKNFKEFLESRGARFLLRTEAVKVDVGRVCLSDGRVLEARFILLATGRSSAKWLSEQMKRLGIKYHHGPIDVGVRVEVPSVVMEPIIKVNQDPKFHIYTRTYDDFVRTFCVNYGGYVVREVYDGFVGVNGHTMVSKKSENTNFALLVRVELTEPTENTTEYGISIAQQATLLGGGNPIIQRLEDLRMGRRSTHSRIKRSNISPTLPGSTPGDIAMAMPHRIVTDILEGLEMLDNVIPGVASSSTLLYAPEIKFYANKLELDKDLQTNVEGIYAAGDGAGITRGLVTAAATGILAARGIMKHV